MIREIRVFLSLFSFLEQAAIRPGLGPTEMAIVMRNLMTRLGHKKFHVHGGDWGAYIGQCIATLFPEVSEDFT